ncbi:lysophospholipase L1-like esterase [Paenibacillus phyllosphaerae]|uniref:Lysophospholipase L1-like esterase n=1 Tax=Paenibacillus phyllosphaerae TaxID=274593 RepID=A0A7W5AUI7_9BACL|nr:SGNH/GDSL hydrolase family protein [Paenibacillus phyllosphaerae]MBB3108923.1 lysophospholipase L1-like esterase [Paenibacillus phyllosphaerae]
MKRFSVLLTSALLLLTTLFSPTTYAQYQIQPEFKFQLPSEIQLVEGQKFAIYYRNVILNSNLYLANDNYLVSARQVTDDTYGQPATNRYNWMYVPEVKYASRDMVIEFRLIDQTNGNVLTQKQVTFHIKPNYVSKTTTIITLGDSFVDSYGVSEALYGSVRKGYLNMIGVNKSAIPGVMDDAWGGYGYRWYTTESYGYRRADRPTSDLKNGMTRNQFINTYTKKFDFSFYMRKYQKGYVPAAKEGKHVDAVVSFVGLNDAIWITTEELKRTLPQRQNEIIEVVNSIKRYDPNIAILLNTLTPQQANDNYLINYGKSAAYPAQVKTNQELWNQMLLDTFDTPQLRARNIYVLPTSANFNPQSDIISDKGLTISVHPTKAGAANIANVAGYALSNLLMK